MIVFKKVKRYDNVHSVSEAMIAKTKKIIQASFAQAFVS